MSLVNRVVHFKQLEMTSVEEKRRIWFDYIIFFMKIIAMHPFEFRFLPQRLRFLRHVFNFFFYVFWHFIIIHLAFIQDVSIYLNLDQTLEEIISYVMNGKLTYCHAPTSFLLIRFLGSIYTYGYTILLYMEFNRLKVIKLFQFMRENFRERSAKGL